MAQWEINKGVGRTVEFKGLKAQYLFLFGGTLLAFFLLVVFFYLGDLARWFCFILGLVGATLGVWKTSPKTRKYGRYGWMKRGPIKIPPPYLLNRRTVFHLIRNLKPKRKA